MTVKLLTWTVKSSVPREILMNRVCQQVGVKKGLERRNTMQPVNLGLIKMEMARNNKRLNKNFEVAQIVTQIFFRVFFMSLRLTCNIGGQKKIIW